MNNQLYKNNPFYKINKEKYNPDILNKKTCVEKDRKTNIFKKSNVVYNAIITDTNTNNIQLNKDKPINNINSIINDKLKERQTQDNTLKPIKQKIIFNKNEQNIATPNFNQIKNDVLQFNNSQQKNRENDKKKHDNIVNDLKNLGIIK